MLVAGNTGGGLGVLVARVVWMGLGSTASLSFPSYFFTSAWVTGTKVAMFHLPIRNTRARNAVRQTLCPFVGAAVYS